MRRLLFKCVDFAVMLLCIPCIAADDYIISSYDRSVYREIDGVVYQTLFPIYDEQMPSASSYFYELGLEKLADKYYTDVDGNIVYFPSNASTGLTNSIARNGQPNLKYTYKGDLFVRDTISKYQYPVLWVSNVFEHIDLVTSVRCPKYAAIYGDFIECRDLKSVDLATIYRIGPHSFSYCDSLTTVSIRRSPIIDREAFEFCPNIRYIIAMDEPAKVVDTSAFDPIVYLEATVYVPEQYYDKYLEHDVWRRFLSIIPIDDAAKLEELVETYK